jgi:hypothetical protein
MNLANMIELPKRGEIRLVWTPARRVEEPETGNRFWWPGEFEEWKKRQRMREVHEGMRWLALGKTKEEKQEVREMYRLSQVDY